MGTTQRAHQAVSEFLGAIEQFEQREDALRNEVEELKAELESCRKRLKGEHSRNERLRKMLTIQESAVDYQPWAGEAQGRCLSIPSLGSRKIIRRNTMPHPTYSAPEADCLDGCSRSFIHRNPSGTTTQTIDSLLSMLMAYKMVQSVPLQREDHVEPGLHKLSSSQPRSPLARRRHSLEGNECLAQVSVDDDEGASGVGLVAAAAVSAAMARAWASAASEEHEDFRNSMSSLVPGRTGKAGYRLVATVNNMGTRKPSRRTLSSSPDLREEWDDTTSTTSSMSSLLAPSCVRANSVSAQAGHSANVTLHWLSKPRNALVVSKKAPNTYETFIQAVTWLRNHGVTVFVEPYMHQELSDDPETKHLVEPEFLSNGFSRKESTDDEGIGPAPKRQDSEGEESPPRGYHLGPIQTWTPQANGSPCLPDDLANLVDFSIVLGGDGTVLWTCYIFGNRAVPPMIPFNMGSLGFLTPFHPERVESVLKKTLSGKLPLILRHRLHCTVIRRLSPEEEDHATGLNQCGDPIEELERVALNEVVIDRGISAFLTNLECFCDGNFVTHVQGDGLIVASPTGSTAYNLAAGGSMCHPQVPGILFTPICPHSLSFRPLIFPDHVSLCVQVPLDSRAEMWASFDGKDRMELKRGDAVIIQLSKWPVPTVCSKDSSRDWFSSVRDGLNWNTRKVQGR